MCALQVSAAVSPDNEQANSFRECVIIRHPRRDGEFAFAFITGQTLLQVMRLSGGCLLHAGRPVFEQAGEAVEGGAVVLRCYKEWRGGAHCVRAASCACADVPPRADRAADAGGGGGAVLLLRS